MTRRDWLLTERPGSRLQARLGRAYTSWLRFSANRLAVAGLLHHHRASARRRLRRRAVALFARRRRSRGSRLLPPSAAHWLGTDDQGRDILSRLIYGSRLTLYVVILVAVIAAPIGLHRRHRRRLCRRLDRRRADAHHRHLPGLPEAHPGAGLRRRARAGHRERGARHRHHLLAALCPHRARRDADRAQLGLHRGGRG